MRNAPLTRYYLDTFLLFTALSAIIAGSVVWINLGRVSVGIGLFILGFLTLNGTLLSALRYYDPDRIQKDSNRASSRLYQDLTDEEVKSQYVNAVQTVREAESDGMGLSPVVNKGSELRQEWRERGNDIDALSEALEDAGYSIPEPDPEVDTDTDTDTITHRSETRDTSGDE